MRLITVFMVSALLLLNVCVSAQKLNYIKKKVTLARLFKELKKQTGYRVIWREELIDADQVIIKADFKNADPKEVIGEVLNRLSIEYLVNDKTKSISLMPKILTAAKNTGGQALVARELQEVEIVSTGYQQIPKERATGSFALVEKKQLDRRVSSETFSKLEGITSGLLFNRNTLNNYPGNFDFSIRGRSTIYANDQPLIVLDNFPFNGDFNSINPNDVAGITVLKDAAAASIWGVRAGNGVIVIDTKRGKFNQPLNIAFNTNLSVSAKPDLFYNQNYISSSDFIDVETFLFDNGKYDAALTDVTRYPVVSPVVQILDRQRKGQSAAETTQQLNALRGNDIRNDELKYFYRNQVAQQYALSLSGGSAKRSHFFSAGYDRRLASLVANNNDRLTLNSQNTFKPIKNLEIEAGVYYIRSNSRVDSTLTDASASQFLPYRQFKSPDGQPAVFDRDLSAAYKQDALSRGFLDWSYRPLEELGRSPFKIGKNDLRINGGLKYTFVDGLSAAVKYQYQQIEQNTNRYSGLDAYMTRSLINQYSVLTEGRVSGYNVPIGGTLYSADAEAISNNLRFQLAYQKDWGLNSVSAIAGYEISSFESDLDRLYKYGYDRPGGIPSSVDTTTVFNLNPTGTGILTESSQKFGKVDRIRSSFANAAYTYDARYTISGSARIDGSNYFGLKTNQKYVPLWSVGGLWNISGENFYDLEWLPGLKLRASYGYNGNLDKGITGLTTFMYISIVDPYTGLPYANIINIGNPELKWEKIGIANFGLDFEFRKRVFTGRLEYYFKNGTDMLGDKAFPSNTGISTLRGNYAKMKAKGIDVMLTAQNFRGKLAWKTSLLISAVRDWVSSYDVIEPGAIYYVGATSSKPVLDRPVYGIYGYQWAGLDPINGDPRGYLNGEISKDYHEIINDATIDNLEYHGSARPTLFGGISNTFTFCRLSLGVNISYKLGYYFRKPSVSYYEMYANTGSGMNSDFARRWQQPGNEKFTNVPSQGEYGSDNFRDVFYYNSSATVARGDHIRLQDISLSFDLDRSNWKRIPVKHIQLYFYANNLGIIWKANDFGLDPDLIPFLGNRFTVPEPKSFAFGMKVNF